MNTSKPRIAVVGSNGQLGGDLIQILTESSSYAVTALSHAQLDITNRQNVMEAIGNGSYYAVVNCAAFTHVDNCEDSPEQALLVNGRGAFEVARACAQSNALCVYLSTDYVFDGEKGSRYLEDDPTNPINVYGTSKLAGEFLVREAAQKWLILRISSVFGKTGSRGKGGNFIETILAKVRCEPVRVVNDIWMSPTYTMDAARLIEKLIRVGATGIFHGSNSGRCTWFELASEAISMIGLDASIQPVTSDAYVTRAKRPKDSSLSNAKLEKVPGCRVRPWQEALRAYLIEKQHLPV